jgi:OTU domain-containing protein 6
VFPQQEQPEEININIAMDELQAKHRKEQRELQSRITQKKKNATKKTRKGVNDECEILERELKERQEAELNTPNDEEVANDIKALDLNGNNEDEDERSDSHHGQTPPPAEPLTLHTTITAQASTTPSNIAPRKRNRQKDRLARRTAEQDAAITAAEAEAADMPDARELELKSMAEHREKLQLDETAIRPDGHCLYSAIAASLPTERVKDSGPYSLGYQNVRHVAAGFIAAHPDDFAAFLEEDVEAYVRKVRETSEWGGAVELQALSRAYGVRINVLQGDGRVESIGEGGKGEEVCLAYYRHSFGLGEHYNALKKREP